jgi:hypothetical protein
VSNLLNDEVLTYLRRARRFPLRGLARHEVGRAIRQPILDAGRSIDGPALDLAIETVKGYPFLVQMVGAELWEADPLTAEINVEQARLAVSRAVASAGELLFTPVLKGLSPGEELFLKAMAALGEDPAPVGEIQRSLGQSTSQTAQLRRRLIAAEVIEPAGRGRVTFAIPGLGAHLTTGS